MTIDDTSSLSVPSTVKDDTSDISSITNTNETDTSDISSITNTIDTGTSDSSSIPETIKTHPDTSKDGNHPTNGKNEININNFHTTMKTTLKEYWLAMITKTGLSIKLNNEEIINIRSLDDTQKKIKGKDKNSIKIKITRNKIFMPNIIKNIEIDLTYFNTVHKAIVAYQTHENRELSELQYSEKITEIKKKIEFIRDVLDDLTKIIGDNLKP